MQTTTNTTKTVIAIIIIILIGLAVYMSRNVELPTPTDTSTTTTVGTNGTTNTNTNSNTVRGTNNTNTPQQVPVSGTGSIVAKPGQVITVTPRKNPLAGTSWIWKDTTFINKSASTLPTANKFVITFGTDGRITSTTDCNSLSGQYAVNNDKISITNTASTKMACQGATLEMEYVKQLTGVTNFTFESVNELDLAIGNTGTMSFGRR